MLDAREPGPQCAVLCAKRWWITMAPRYGVLRYIPSAGLCRKFPPWRHVEGMADTGPEQIDNTTAFCRSCLDSVHGGKRRRGRTGQNDGGPEGGIFRNQHRALMQILVGGQVKAIHHDGSSRPDFQFSSILDHLCLRSSRAEMGRSPAGSRCPGCLCFGGAW